MIIKMGLVMLEQGYLLAAPLLGWAMLSRLLPPKRSLMGRAVALRMWKTGIFLVNTTAERTAGIHPEQKSPTG